MTDADGVDGSAAELTDVDMRELLALERHKRATEFTAQGLLAEFALENWEAFEHFAEQHGHAATALRERWISGWSEESDVARQSGMSKRYVQAAIAGERRMPEDVRAVLEQTLGVDLWAEDSP